MTPETRTDIYSKLKYHIRSRLISGLLLLLPLLITFLILRVLYLFTVGMLVPMLNEIFGNMPDFLIFLISIAVPLLIIYIIGLLANHFISRKIVSIGEKIITQVPLLRTLYSAAKNVVDTFSVSTTGTSAFKTVVFIEFPRKGTISIGFITGCTEDSAGRQYSKVFVPTAPNPTSGFFMIVPKEEIIKTEMSVEDGLKMVVSGGILSPKTFNKIL
ncbi:MAG: hypothetical protein A2017_20590 [Lentisphaerae bacterium GWF2_44_16]|nr:MAG: hypothetical protein A2017_20590 [Lentisphaerae bacterium GWF2_44_16]